MHNNHTSPRKMVRNKRDLKFSPHRNRPISRATARVGAKLDSGNSSSCANVKVVVRVRPPNQKELGSNSRIMGRSFVTRAVVCRTVVKIADNNVIIFDPNDEDEPFFYHGVQQRGRDLLKKANKNIQFVFDRVFGYESDNTEVFDNSTKNLIPSLMDGYNCSVFVYGATGAGKTHTMLGHNENPGITFLTMKELFQQMENFKNEREFELAITYLEVYNETVKDLLNPGAPLHLREDGKFGVCVSGIKIHRIKSPEELFALLAEGNCNRTQHPTDANAESSRSHAVFQVYVNMQFLTTGQRRIAKLSMIDLAGSERGAATGCSGIRFTEGANINKSLLALGNCINSLADGQRHVPYRDSKLTRLLKDSLGGNCQTVMIANVSPSNLNYEDTYNTLKYATRAKKIKSNVAKNVINCTLTISQYQKIVADLNKENESLKEELNKLKSQTETVPASATVTCSCDENKEKIEENKENIEENKSRTKKHTAYKTHLQAILKEKVNIEKQIQRLVNSEKLLQHRIKFKEFSETIISESCVYNEQLEAGLNKVQTTVGAYQRQLSSIQAQIQDLQSQQRAVEIKLQNLIEQEEIPTDDTDLLMSEIDLKTEQFDLQREHTNKVLNICQAEIEQKEKMITKMYDVCNSYYQLLKVNDFITDSMSSEYFNVVLMARGVRTVSWQDDNDVIDTKSQDSGVCILPTPIVVSEPKSKINTFTPEKSIGSSEKRPTVKRKLYEIETKSTSAIDNFIKKHLVNDTESKTTPKLNETIVLTQPMNADNINSTFLLQDKDHVAPKKKTALSDRSNDILPKAILTRKTSVRPMTGKTNIRTVTNKFYNNSTSSKTQRFPLRKNTQETVRSNRTTETSTLRMNRFKP